MLKYVSLATLTIQNAAVAISMTYSRTRPGDMFIASTAVVMAEVVKLFSSVFLLYREDFSVKHTIMTLYTHLWEQKLETLKVSIPAFIYLIQNNLLYISASNLDAATYQVTYQMKILTTAVLSVIMLNTVLRRNQWISLFLLTAGVVLVQLSSSSSSAVEKTGIEKNQLVGFLAAVAACCCSGFAGVYFEKILKGSEVSLWVRNVQLSFLSLPLGVLTIFGQDWSVISAKGFFFGYDMFVWYLILLNATGGLLVAMVVKYADNILKGFATSSAILISTVASVFLFNFTLTLQFMLGTSCVIGSIFLYSYEEKAKTEGKSKEVNPLAGKV